MNTSKAFSAWLKTPIGSTEDAELGKALDTMIKGEHNVTRATRYIADTSVPARVRKPYKRKEIRTTEEQKAARKAANARYALAHPEVCKEARRRWQRKNRPKAYAAHKRWVLRKRLVKGGWTNEGAMHLFDEETWWSHPDGSLIQEKFLMGWKLPKPPKQTPEERNAKRQECTRKWRQRQNGNNA